MASHKKHTHIHPVHAYMYIGLAIGISIWLITLASPASVKADADVSLNQLITEKDTVTEMELLKPDVVLSTEEVSTVLPEITETVANETDLSVTILPSGKHQSTKSSITFLFSHPVSLPLLKSAVTIVPNVSGSFSVNGRIATFTPDSPLAPETEYQVQVSPNIHGKGGETMKSPVSAHFETRAETHILAVPYYRQQFSRSCEAASLRMALAYLGTVTSDKEIVTAAGYDPREPNWADKTWDDPYEMFVGFLDGKQVGYGMYASALAKASSALGHSSRVLKNPTSEELAQAIWNDTPVVIWGYIKGTAPKLSYFYTDAGKRIPIYSNEHARTIVGVVGSPENPVGFYVHDPLSGLANEYWTAQDLEKHMSLFGAVSNQALVIE